MEAGVSYNKSMFNSLVCGKCVTWGLTKGGVTKKCHMQVLFQHPLTGGPRSAPNNYKYATIPCLTTMLVT